MNQNNKNIVIALLVLAVIALAFFFMKKNTALPASLVSTSTEPVVSEEETPTPTKPGEVKKPSPVINNSSTKGFYSYGNGTYHFTIQYPSYVKQSTSFSTFHEIGNNWRVYPSQTNQGKNVVELAIHTIDQGTYSTGKQTYPLYFAAFVRVGVSQDVKDCYATDAGFTNQKVTNVTIGGVTFKRFSVSDGATMKYVQLESYRTIHNNMCYVLEQIKNGSNYRDEKMTMGTTDATLNGYYNVGDTIIKTFRFVQ